MSTQNDLLDGGNSIEKNVKHKWNIKGVRP